MSLFNVFDVAGSGMAAQSTRLNLTSSNLANAESVAGSEEEAYRSRQPVFAAAMQAARGDGATGVEIRGVVESDAPVQGLYQPQHPLANEEGYVFRSNVNTVESMVNMISASRSYQNNVEVMSTSRDLMLQTLQIGR